MRTFFLLCIVALVVQQTVAPPVTNNKKDVNDNKIDSHEVDEKEEMEEAMEYHRYLKEVVQALESDDDFRKKLEKAEEVDIRTGKIAHELEFVSHKVRTKLDELKRQELERLRHLAVREYQLENGLDPDHLKIAEHLDHENPHTFEIDDLKKLIAKTTEDLAEADRKRREEFKEYEMQKKFEQEEKMKGMDEEKKKKYKEEMHDLEEKHKKHQPLHHPGSKQQLEEVWEKQDHMENQDFDPRTFFYLHDLDGNRVWDQNEVKALFLKELDKLYSEGAPEDDLRERAEEMERMREHLFNEADLNKDGLISYNEFLEQTKRPEFTKDPGWQSLDEQQIYSQQEYDAFERQRQMEIEKLIAQGVLPPHPASYPSGHPEQFPPQYANAHPGQGVAHHDFVPPMAQGHHQQQFQDQQHHPQQFQGQAFEHPQQLQAHMNQQQQFQGQKPQLQQFQGQVPQYPQFQAHVAQQQAQGQAPQHQQQFQAQVPQQQFQAQVPQQQQGQVVQQQQTQGQVVQQQQAQGQVPQQQQAQGQVPQQQQAQGQVPQQQQAQGQVPQQRQQQPAQAQVSQQQPVPKTAQQQQNVPQQQQNVPVQQQQQNVAGQSHNEIPAVQKV